MMRGSLARLEMVPNVGSLAPMFGMPRLGSPKFVVLNTLKISHRSVAAMCGRIVMRRCTVRSNVWDVGPRSWFRCSLPNVPDGTA